MAASGVGSLRDGRPRRRPAGALPAGPGPAADTVIDAGMATCVVSTHLT